MSILESSNKISAFIGLGLVVLLLGACTKNSVPANEMTPKERPLLISHAGGELDDTDYCNCEEAFNLSYDERGHRYFEVDLHWTRDGELVLIHDWGQTYNKWFGGNANENMPPSLDQFLSLKMANGRTQMSLDELASWLRDHPDAFVVTDIKRDNTRALTVISDRYPTLRAQFIPQIYQLDEYEQVSALGYEKIILTLYKARANDFEVLEFARNNKLFAVTGWTGKLRQSTLIEALSAAGIPVFVHTINYNFKAIRFLQRDVHGIYTDTLSESDLEIYRGMEEATLLPVVAGGDSAKTVEIDISNSKKIVLFVDELGDRSHDHANWCELTLIDESGTQADLTAANLVDARQGWGPLGDGRSVTGGPLSIGGQSCQSGWGTHAPSELILDIPKQSYKTLRLTYGVDDTVNSAGRMQFGFILVSD